MSQPPGPARPRPTCRRWQAWRGPAWRPTVACRSSPVKTMLRRFFLAGRASAVATRRGTSSPWQGSVLDGSGRRTATGLVRPSARTGARRQLVAWCAEHSGGSLLRVVAETTSPESEELVAGGGPAPHLRRARDAAHAVRRPRRPAPARACEAPLERGRPPCSTRPTRVLRRPARVPRHPARGVGRLPRRATTSSSGDDSRVALTTPVRRGLRHALGQLDRPGRGRAGVAGEGLGAHLVVRSLRALSKRGCEQAWLAVNVDNPAHDLYLRLGFRRPRASGRATNRPR